jgi:hypothetical protein
MSRYPMVPRWLGASLGSGHPNEAPRVSNDEIISVRYIVDDVDTSVAFYTELLRFEILTHFAPAFADVKRGRLPLLLSGPKSSAGRPMADGATPGPGRWNRIGRDDRRLCRARGSLRFGEHLATADVTICSCIRNDHACAGRAEAGRGREPIPTWGAPIWDRCTLHDHEDRGQCGRWERSSAKAAWPCSLWSQVM